MSSEVEKLKKAKLLEQLAKMERKESIDNIDKDSLGLCWHLQFDKYFYMANGMWRLEIALKNTAAIGHLLSFGYSLDDATMIIKTNSLRKVKGFTFSLEDKPIVTIDGEDYINSYIRPTLVPKQGEYPTIKKIIMCIAGYNQEAFDYILNWIAFKVQNPLSKPLTSLIFIGPPGTGKGTFNGILREMIGTHNTKTLNSSDLNNNFNSHYIHALLTICDEAMASEGFLDNSQKLKQLITDTHIMCAGKNQPLFSIENRSAFIFSSNKNKPILIENGDRRFSVFRTPFAVFGDNSPYTQMLRDIHLQSNGKFTDSFMEEIAGFMYDMLALSVNSGRVKTPFDNDARKELINASKTSFEVWMDEVMDQGIDNMIEDYKSNTFDKLDLELKHWSGDGFYSTELINKAFCWWIKNGSGYHQMGKAKLFSELDAIGIKKVQKRIPSTENRIQCLSGFPAAKKEIKENEKPLKKKEFASYIDDKDDDDSWTDPTKAIRWNTQDGKAPPTREEIRRAHKESGLDEPVWEDEIN